jgi:ADP-ribose pyrophosphatase YjhB (NUDIX family)
MIADEVKYCPRCGSQLIQDFRFGKSRPTCPRCDWVFFPDPKVAAAVLVEKDGKVLLVRRANDPARGLWTLPAGFIDAGEDPVQAAVRECLEETGLRIRITDLLDVLSGLEHPRGVHIVIFYRGEILEGEMTARDDVDRVAFFGRENLPPLAFSTTAKILQMTK